MCQEKSAGLVVAVLCLLTTLQGLQQGWAQNLPATSSAYQQMAQQRPNNTPQQEGSGQQEERLAQEVRRLSEANKQLQEQVDTLKGELAKAEAEHAQVQAALQEQQTAQAALAEEAGRLRQAVETQQRDSATLRQELETTRSTLAEARQSQQKAQQELDTTRTALTEARQGQQKAQQELESTRATLAQAQQGYQKAQQESATIRTQLQQVTAEAAAMQQRLQASTDRQAQEVARLQTLYDRLSQPLNEEVQQKDVNLQKTADHLAIHMASESLFRPPQGTIGSKGQKVLEKIAEVLQAFPEYQVRVEGYTDSIPVSEAFRSRWPTNWELSTARAAAIVRYLEGKGIAAQRLSVAGYGANRPVAPNDTEAGRSQNRRMHILVWPSPAPGGTN